MLVAGMYYRHFYKLPSYKGNMEPEQCSGVLRVVKYVHKLIYDEAKHEF